MLIKKKELQRRVLTEGAADCANHLTTALEEGHVKPEDFSIRDLAESLVVNDDGTPVGREWVESMGPHKRGGVQLREAVGAVDSTAFLDITGQIIYTRMMTEYQSEAFVATGLCDNVPTRLQGEKIPGMTGITDSTQEVAEGMPYPELGFGSDFIQTPVTTKRGHILSLTKEMMFFDRTGLVLRRAGQIGNILGVHKEKKLLDLLFGIVNNFKWRGTTYNTYQTSAPWINKISGNGIQDWTQVDAAEQLFANMLDPNTGEPITVDPTGIIHMPGRNHQFRRVIHATEIRVATPGFATTTNPSVTTTTNTVTPYQLYTSRLAYRRLIASGVSASNAKDYWLLGNYKEAAAWMENWPITVVQAPNNSEAEFKQDIALRWKASEMGEAAMLDPRMLVLSYQA